MKIPRLETSCSRLWVKTGKNILNLNLRDKENLKMTQNESSQAFRKYFVYGAVFGATATVIVWYALKFFQ